MQSWEYYNQLNFQVLILKCWKFYFEEPSRRILKVEPNQTIPQNFTIVGTGISITRQEPVPVPDKRAYKRRRRTEGKGRVSPRSTRAQAPRHPPIRTTGASFSAAFSASKPCEKPTIQPRQAQCLSSSLFPSDALQRFFTVNKILLKIRVKFKTSVSDPWTFSTDPDPGIYNWAMDPDPNAVTFKTSKKIVFLNFFAFYFLKVHFFHFSRIKNHTEDKKSRNQDFS